MSPSEDHSADPNREWRFEALDHLQGPARPPLQGGRREAVPAPDAVIEAGADALAWWGRAVRQADALGGLSKLEAPAELDGRVVAALQAGVRQERASGALSALEALEAPAELEGRVAAAIGNEDRAESGLKAPRVLDRLVGERVETEGSGVAGSLVGSLPRQQAPRSLGDRLDQGLSASAAGPSFRKGAWLALGSMAAVGLAVATLLFTKPREEAAPSAEDERMALRAEAMVPRIEISFDVIEHGSLADAPLTLQETRTLGGLIGEVLGGQS